MTFEDWWDGMLDCDFDYDSAKRAWNAAINAARNRLNKDQYYIAVYDEGYVETNPAERLKDLLTSK
jgi:hypothetical protein